MKNREDFSELNEQELEEKYKHFKEELFNLRFQDATNQLSNPSRISMVRRNIARVKTYITRLEKEKLSQMLKQEYDALLKEENIDSMKVPLSTKISKLKSRLSAKARKVNKEIKNDCDHKINELVKSLKGQISKKIKDSDPKQEAQLRAFSKRLKTPGYTIRKKFLDKLAEMGLNEASQIATIKEDKRAKLREIENIRVLQRELTTGRLPF